MSAENNSTIWIAIESLSLASSVAANSEVLITPPATRTWVPSGATSLLARHWSPTRSMVSRVK